MEQQYNFTMLKMGKKGQAGGVLVKIILGFVAIFVGAQLVPEVWDIIIGSPSIIGINGTTKTFLEMVPWMSAIGLMVTAVTVFLVKGKK